VRLRRPGLNQRKILWGYFQYDSNTEQSRDRDLPAPMD
jgi:hypothetical protein